MVKIGNYWRKHNSAEALSKHHYPQWSICDLPANCDPVRPYLQALCISPNWELTYCEKPYSLWTFIKKQLQTIANLHGCLRQCITVGANNRLTKSLWKQKLGNEIPLGHSKALIHCRKSVSPGTMPKAVCMLRAMPVHGKDLRRPSALNSGWPWDFVQIRSEG